MIRFESNNKYHEFLKLKGDIWYWGPQQIANPRKIELPVKYTTPGLAGDVYQVVMFKKIGKKVEHVENFNCVLLEPQHYIVSVSENGYSGLCGRQFDGSPYSDMLEEMQKNPYKNWGQLCYQVFHTEQRWRTN